MISVYLINQNCPNAYWNGTSTNYCPIFDADDVVSHEWGHAYTEYTHGLIYAYQSGALNESYSDIFGETMDLLNNVDGSGGNNNTEPYPNGQRWLVGEDLGQQVQELLLRDMYDPDRLASPGKVSSPELCLRIGRPGRRSYELRRAESCLCLDCGWNPVCPRWYLQRPNHYWHWLDQGRRDLLPGGIRLSNPTTDFPTHATAIKPRAAT